MFTHDFVLTEKAPHDESILSRVASGEPWNTLKAGVYNNGLLSICDNSRFDFETLGEWSDLVGERALPLAITAWGDVFCMSFSAKRCFFLVPEENGVSDLGASITGILDNLFANERLRASLLDYPRYEAMRPRLPDLLYGQCYVLKPYRIFGGDPTDVAAYEAGDAKTYLSLVAQTLRQIDR